MLGAKKQQINKDKTDDGGTQSKSNAVGHLRSPAPFLLTCTRTGARVLYDSRASVSQERRSSD
jgi:hypothetical protein